MYSILALVSFFFFLPHLFACCILVNEAMLDAGECLFLFFFVACPVHGGVLFLDSGHILQ
ncbi:hypothetical protein BJX76DRAFT_316520 [Aspergillus varians]